ncbi:MAG TPA: FAD-dependent oxidoreductase [Mycobacterium sp.]|nr:FAD-dependent oxidoreductase [Mycobacterium sp.]
MAPGPDPIVVVGAGIAGLAAAAALQRRGYRVRVVESRPDPCSGAGISLWPNALAALDRLGLGDQVRRSGGRVTAGALRWYDGSWIRRPDRDRLVRALGEPLVVIRRSRLQEVLVGALEPGTVQYGVTAAAPVRRGDGVELAVTGPGGAHRWAAAAVIGAGGSRSVIARALNGPLPGRYTGHTAWRGVAETAIDPELSGETLGPGLQFGHTPLGPGQTYWFAAERAPRGQRRPEGELTYLRRRLAGWADPVPALLAATDPAAVLRHDLEDRATAPAWSAGPVVLIGDAAHPMRPHLGQGGAQALEDAVILAAFVEGHRDLVAAFGAFARHRRRRVRRVVAEAAVIGRLVGLRPPALAAALVRASAAVPEAVLTRHLAGIAARSAFELPGA